MSYWCEVRLWCGQLTHCLQSKGRLQCWLGWGVQCCWECKWWLGGRSCPSVLFWLLCSCIFFQEAAAPTVCVVDGWCPLWWCELSFHLSPSVHAVLFQWSCVLFLPFGVGLCDAVLYCCPTRLWWSNWGCSQLCICRSCWGLCLACQTSSAFSGTTDAGGLFPPGPSLDQARSSEMLMPRKCSDSLHLSPSNVKWWALSSLLLRVNNHLLCFAGVPGEMTALAPLHKVSHLPPVCWLPQKSPEIGCCAYCYEWRAYTAWDSKHSLGVCLLKSPRPRCREWMAHREWRACCWASRDSTLHVWSRIWRGAGC